MYEPLDIVVLVVVCWFALSFSIGLAWLLYINHKELQRQRREVQR